MRDSPEDDSELSSPSFWNSRYQTSDGIKPTHEWFKSYQDLLPFLSRELFSLPQAPQTLSLLHLGAGDSTLPSKLLDQGYTKQTCIDFSRVLVDLMQKLPAAKGITWIHSDVRSMHDAVATGSVDVAFDKGTLDAMIYGSPWSPPDSVQANTQRYMDEVARVLKPGGVFLYVTFRQPHFVKPLLNRRSLWDLRVEVLGDGEGGFEYFGFVLKHARVDGHRRADG